MQWYFRRINLVGWIRRWEGLEAGSLGIRA